MKDNIPVRNIEGIGPAIEARLHTAGIYTVFDLIRASAAQIHLSVSDRVSLQQVQGWRTMAVFMQIEEMTNQWAEALVKGGVSSIEELVQKKQVELSDILSNAASSGLIPEAPAEALLYEMRIDAMQLHHTGSLDGTIRDQHGRPLADVVIKIGGRKVNSDERGRFRVNRIRLGTYQRLVMKHADYATLLVENPPLSHNENHIGVSVFTMSTRDNASTSTSRLSEYDGDILPELTDFSMSSEQRPYLELRERDILIIHRFYANGKEVQLTSKFLEYEEGTYYAISYRVPLADLPPAPAVKDAYIYKQGVFEPIHLNANRLKYLKDLRRIRKARRGKPRPQTLMEFDRSIADIAGQMN